MSRLELLNVFVNERLTAAGEEILRAVRDALVEYQGELLRSKEENERLRRLLNVAVQQLLLQPEPPSALSRDDAQPCEWRSGAILLPQVKEEPNVRHIQTDCSQEAGDSEEGTCSHAEPRRELHPLPPRTASPPPRTPHGLKAESDSEDDRRQPSASSPASSPTAHSNCRAARRDSCAASAAKSHRTQKADQPARGFLRSSGRASAHILQIKNVRSLKPPPPRSPHPGQGIQRWHSCRECGKGFSFACQLEVHMRWHTKEKPYSCAVCRKSFTTVSMLKRHHRIHTGEKPFRCHVCGKCFNQSAHLNTHFRLHTRERAGWSRVPQSK